MKDSHSKASIQLGPEFVPNSSCKNTIKKCRKWQFRPSLDMNLSQKMNPGMNSGTN